MPIFKVQPEWMLGSNTPQVKNSQIGSGYFGNLDTVQKIKEVARASSVDPRVRELALRILQTSQIPSQDYASEAIAIAKFVQKKVRYVRDINGVETLHDPVTLIDQIQRGEAQGDCDDMSLLLASLLLSIGHQPFVRIVRYRGMSGPYQHIYVVVYEKNHNEGRRRIVLDCILKRAAIGTEVPHSSGDELKI
jgi:hypothetical protein